MATRVPAGQHEVFADAHFPRAGLDVSSSFTKQPPRDVSNGSGDYARSTPFGLNVRGFDPVLNRDRGGSRCGLSKYIAAPIVADWLVQELALIVSTEATLPQQSNLGRIVSLVGVSQGDVYRALAGDTTWTQATNATGNTPPLNYTGILFSAANAGKLWFADGVNWCYYDPRTNTVNLWAPLAPSLLPVDSAGNTPRLICTWRGRTVLSGLLLDPQNWFMSRVGDPTDFDYSPASVSPTQAIAGNNAPQGLIGDVVTALIPYSDDVLFVGGDHTIYMINGDPMAGGQIDLVSDAIGIAWGQAWCKDPYGNLYVFSNRAGIFTMVPGQQPQRISQAIEQLLQTIDTGNNSIRMIWNDRFQGLHVFVTPLSAPGPAGGVTHFFYEQRTGAWWLDQFADINHDPLCCVTFDGNQAADRIPLIGCWDGYVRGVDPDATTDDGRDIESSIYIGPILTQDLDDMLLKDLQAVMSETASPISYSVYVGSSAEKALESDPVASGTWQPGRNPDSLVRRSGHAVYVKLSSSDPWSMETIRMRIASTGKVRRRGKA